MDESGLPKDGGADPSRSTPGRSRCWRGWWTWRAISMAWSRFRSSPTSRHSPAGPSRAPRTTGPCSAGRRRQLLAEAAIPTDRIRAVTITTQRHTLINVDRDGNSCGRPSSGSTTPKAEMRKVLPG